MDDSERTYGYSDDIYHGPHDRKDEKSYEYGPESSEEEVEAEALSPEDAAMHIEGSHRDEEPVASGETGTYDYGRDDLAATESFTWDSGEGGLKKEPDLSEQRLEPAKHEP